MLRLPGEIRNRVYSYVFSGHVIGGVGELFEIGFHIFAEPLGYTLSPLVELTTTSRQIRAETVTFPIHLNIVTTPALANPRLWPRPLPKQLHEITTEYDLSMYFEDR